VLGTNHTQWTEPVYLQVLSVRPVAMGLDNLLLELKFCLF